MTHQPPATQQWTPQLVENMLFREFVKGENIEQDLPPTPQANPNHGFYSEASDSMKFLSRYTRMGPSAVSALQSSQNQGYQAGTKSLPSTPQHKNGHPGFGPSSQQNQQARTPKGVNSALPPRTPKATPTTPSHADAKRVTSPKPPARPVIEWPSNVPTNAQLKSDNRNAVKKFREERIIAQSGVDFDLVFRQQDREMPLEKIFQRYPKVLKKVQAVRGMSGDWRNDVFTAEEEAQYKHETGHKAPYGPSQAKRRGF